MTEARTSAVAADPAFEALLDHLKEARGFDLTGYKRPSLMRRVERRMREIGIASFDAYRNVLDERPEEFVRLFETIRINVTAFFRDAAAWDALKDAVVPRLLAARKGQEPIRLWCAGCATGQEAYSLAILVAEAVGTTAFGERVTLYATDVDENALADARSGVYTEREMAGVSPRRRETFFEEGDGRCAVRDDLRRSIRFGRLDLIGDAPISRIDLLTCRNTLMYFEAAAQARVIERFHFALNDGGFLFLGRAEMPVGQGARFAAFDLKHRVFTREPDADRA